MIDSELTQTPRNDIPLGVIRWQLPARRIAKRSLRQFTVALLTIGLVTGASCDGNRNGRQPPQTRVAHTGDQIKQEEEPKQTSGRLFEAGSEPPVSPPGSGGGGGSAAATPGSEASAPSTKQGGDPEEIPNIATITHIDEMSNQDKVLLTIDKGARDGIVNGMSAVWVNSPKHGPMPTMMLLTVEKVQDRTAVLSGRKLDEGVASLFGKYQIGDNVGPMTRLKWPSAKMPEPGLELEPIEGRK